MQCNSCNAQFAEEASRNAHYRSDWHRYNLKRKVADLPGVTEEWFESRKAAAASALAAESSIDKKAGNTRLVCQICSKQYATRRAYDNHLKSRGHVAKAAMSPAGTLSDPIVKQRKEREVKVVQNGLANVTENQDDAGKAHSKKIAEREEKMLGGIEEKEGEGEESEDEEGEWEEVEDEDEAAAILEEEERMGRVTKSGECAKDQSGEERSEKEGEEVWEWESGQCLFCAKAFKGRVGECVSHMHKDHGFFIPDAEFVSDLPGLLSYLALKINKGCLCLYCDERGKVFPSAEAVRAHMESKSHAKLRYGDGSGIGEEELEEFYDFSPRSKEEGKDMQMVLSGDESVTHLSLNKGGFELVIRKSDWEGGDVTKALGYREYARYYKQKPRPSAGNAKLMSIVYSRILSRA